MEADQALARLLGYQQRIARVIASAADALGGENASGPRSVAAARWELMRVLREYQLFKHTEIFDPLIAHGGSSRATEAARAKARCIELGRDFNDHVQRWSLEAPVNAWPDYRADALAMSSRISRHLKDEADQVARLLAGMARTRVGQGDPPMPVATRPRPAGRR